MLRSSGQSRRSYCSATCPDCIPYADSDQESCDKDSCAERFLTSIFGNGAKTLFPD